MKLNSFQQYITRKGKMATDFNHASAIHTMFYFLTGAINIGLHAPEHEVKYGHPIKGIIEQALDKGLEPFVEKLFTDYGDQGECSLNGSGLKVRWRWERGNDKRQGHLILAITSDHGTVYDTTVKELNAYIQENHWARSSS